MLPHFLRYPLRAVADVFFSQARSRRYGFLRIFVSQRTTELQQDTHNGTCIALIVTKHAAKGADRQKIKRQVRTALIELFQSSPTLFEPPHDVVIVVSQRPQTYELLKQHLHQALSDALALR